VDYSETFSLVIKPATIHLVLAFAMHFDWPIKQLDVSNAFLHGYLDKKVFYGATTRLCGFLMS
jgi:hypothetical protein